MKVALIFGTRPEAIKMAPLVHALRRQPTMQPLVYVSAQHREMLDQVLRVFAIQPDADLDLMQPGQRLVDLTARSLTGLHDLLERDKPDLVLVHGDTTTALTGALAAYYRQIPVGHVEAGLRTHQRYSPFPEELNRQLVDHLASYHFAPTAAAVANLTREGIAAEHIVQTGNTVIDALLLTLRRLGDTGKARLLREYPLLAPAVLGQRRLILVTSHRRENHGAGLSGICQALLQLSQRYHDIDIVYPVHPNPQVRSMVSERLAGRERLHLLEPLEYDLFCYLMSICHLILTDSGGIQEEAPALHKPVLVLRDTSERPEAVAVGAAVVVGTQPANIVSAAARVLEDDQVYRAMATAGSPYGDGHAAARIVDFLSTRTAVRRAA